RRSRRRPWRSRRGAPRARRASRRRRRRLLSELFLDPFAQARGFLVIGVLAAVDVQRRRGLQAQRRALIAILLDAILDGGRPEVGAELRHVEPALLGDLLDLGGRQ